MRRKKQKPNGIFRQIITQPIVKKAIGYMIVALISYFVNHLQTNKEISKLQSDNVDLSWAVDYFRN